MADMIRERISPMSVIKEGPVRTQGEETGQHKFSCPGQTGLDRIKSRHQHAGLVNYGNTCYFNCVVQVPGGGG